MGIEVDLGSHQGNALELVAMTYSVARHCGISEQAAKDITASMRKGTYVDLLNVMDQEFPGYFKFHADPRGRG